MGPMIRTTGIILPSQGSVMAMKQRVIGLVCGLVVAVGLLAGMQVPAWSEDNVPLEEMLVEKGVLTKEEAAKVQESVIAKWVNRIFDDNNSNGSMNDGVDQNRVRFRLRFGADLQIHDLTVGFRLVSGTGQQVSTNQTETNLFTGKNIWIDRAYLSWHGTSTPWLKVTAGKMPNPFFVIYTGDVVWDDDVNPEGFAENLQFGPAEHVSLFLNAGQFALNEVGSNNHDPWMIGEQGGASVAVTPEVKTTLAVAFYDSINVSGGDATYMGETIQQGNSRSATCATAVGVATPPSCVLLNNFRVLDVTTQVNLQAGPIPVSLMGDYVRNLANTTLTGMKTGTATGNEGYQIGGIVGKASDANTWEVAYFYKVLQTDATLADLADSDFGNGGTARRGNIVWAAYNPMKYLQIKLKYFMTKSITPVTTGAGVCGNTAGNLNGNSGCGDINRLQADVSVKF